MCHGLNGNGNGTVVQKGYYLASNLNEHDTKNRAILMERCSMSFPMVITICGDIKNKLVSMIDEMSFNILEFYN